MDYRNLSKEQLDEYADFLFAKLQNEEEVRNWIFFFLDLDIPSETIFENSTSNPLNAIWTIYNSFLDNKSSEDSPAGYILMSSRESLKTISVAIAELLLLLHFELDIAHAASIEPQSAIGLGYITSFLSKVEPLMAHRGWLNESQNKRTLSFTAPSGKKPYIKILIATAKGFNSIHTNVLFIDELDLTDPAALKEAKGIISFSKGIHGKTVYLSTRKYSFGAMAHVIEKKDELNFKLMNWNVIDVSERCPKTRHLPDKPKQIRYIANDLPLKQIAQEQYNFLAVSEQNKYTKLENVYEGCTTCSLLPICKMKLASKASECAGGFWKPIGSVKGKFAEYDPDTASAQLLCLKPGSTGLVYPRLVITPSIESTNVITLEEAYFSLTNKSYVGVTEEMVLAELKKNETEINAGTDWGFTHSSAIGIFAFPTDEQWLIDTFAAPNLEFSELLEVALKYQERYEPSKWWCDGARPEFLATFNKHGLRSPKFTKDVIGGIAAVRAKIVDGVGKRRFKILLTESNKKAIAALNKHKFILDGMGEPTDKPDDEPHIADIADMVRMVFQNKCPVKGAGKIYHTISEPKSTNEQIAQTTNSSFLKAVQEATGVQIANKIVATKKKNGFFFSW